MMLDTNAISALAARQEPMCRLLKSFPRVFLPFIAVGEYRFGVLLSHHRDPLLLWLEELQRIHTVLYADSATLAHYAEIRKELTAHGTPIPSNDLWIAALGRQHSLAIVSRDKHFDLVSGLHRIEW